MKKALIFIGILVLIFVVILIYLRFTERKLLKVNEALNNLITYANNSLGTEINFIPEQPKKSYATLKSTSNAYGYINSSGTAIKKVSLFLGDLILPYENYDLKDKEIIRFTTLKINRTIYMFLDLNYFYNGEKVVFLASDFDIVEL